MLSAILEPFFDEMFKMANKKNRRMPAPTRSNVQKMMSSVRSVPEAQQLTNTVGEKGLFKLLHSMRRWYSGGTMGHSLVNNRDQLSSVMDLNPQSVVGTYRGFKVPNNNPLAQLKPGDTVDLDVARNRGLSSWTTDETRAHKFSGGGKGKTGIVVRLASPEGVTPVLAPPEKTQQWFNRVYENTMGTAFRNKEREYLVHAPKLRVEVVKVKK